VHRELKLDDKLGQASNSPDPEAELIEKDGFRYAKERVLNAAAGSGPGVQAYAKCIVEHYDEDAGELAARQGITEPNLRQRRHRLQEKLDLESLVARPHGDGGSKCGGS
jgi:hypothetical protein